MNWNKGGPGTKRGFGFGGFAISTGKKEDPKLPQPSHSAFGSSSASGYGKLGPPQLPSFYKIGSKRANFDEENAYFEDEEEDSSNIDLPYIPAENSPTRQQFNMKTTDSDSEEDPLEAFMAEVEDQAARDMKRLEEKDKGRENAKGIRDDIEEEDDQEAYFRYMAENPTAGVIPEEEEDIYEYDSDGNPVALTSKKIIDPLPPIDHSEIEYPPFEKNFYQEHEEINSLTPQQIIDLQQKLNLRGVAVALSGRDMIGIAKTGSGKTAAFIWPMLVHIMDQKELEPGDGPIGVIVCPTRELCQQIHSECKRFGKAYNLRSVAVYGGGSMWEQAKALQEGAEIVVCTPGRLIDHVKKKATNLQRVTYLVFDEADRMFDMGFECQVRSVASHVQPDRQTLLFSATFRKKIEKLARDILIDPIRVVQGDIGEANEDVTQVVEILPTGPDKWCWLTNRLVEFLSKGSVLLFVTKKANAEELASNLKLEDHILGLLHGDMDQNERNKVISEFKKKTIPLLVATDVAARGLDIPSIKTVINYDVARDIDTHTHRIGRTGRAGEKGIAYTLLTPKDVNFAGDLVRNLEGANQYVSKELMDLAMQNAWFRKSRFKGGKGKKLNVGGGGLGYRERPGLGADISTERNNNNNNIMSNYEAYKPSSGAMGDRLSAMKAAFQSQYKTHFVAASTTNQKTGSSAGNASGWTSAGSLNSIPTSSSSANSSDPAALAAKGIPGFVNMGTLSSVPAGYPCVSIPSLTSPSPTGNARETGSGGRESGSTSGSSRDRYSDSRSSSSSSRHNDGQRHGDGGSSRHNDGQRHGDGGSSRHNDNQRHGDGGRHGDSYRHGDGSSRHGEGHRHSESRHSSSSSRHGDNRSNNDSRNGESRKESGSSRDSKGDGFVVPEPPKRKKSRWDS